METAIKKQTAIVPSVAPATLSPLAQRLHEPRLHVSGQHAHALTGAMYQYHADYLTLGTMVDWTAQLGDGDGDLPRIGGSIRLSRGQTQGLAPRLVMHMIGQTIDAMPAPVVVPA